MLTTSDCGSDASDAAFDSACDFDVWFTRDFSSPHDYDYNTSVNGAQCSKPQAVLWSSYDGNLTLINLLNTKFSCFTSFPMQHQKLKVSTLFVSCKIIFEDRRRIVDESTKELVCRLPVIESGPNNSLRLMKTVFFWFLMKKKLTTKTTLRKFQTSLTCLVPLSFVICALLGTTWKINTSLIFVTL